MNKIEISSLIIETTKEMLRDYRNLKFMSAYSGNDIRINATALINLMNSTLDELREYHPDGEKIYNVISISYMKNKKYPKAMLCDMIGMACIDRDITSSTLFRWKKEAVSVYAYALWTNPKFSILFIKIFNNERISSIYNELSEEYKKLKNEYNLGVLTRL